MRDFLSITNALADESRLRILLALRGRELCVCQITELLGLATSTVSKHVSVLKQAGLVIDRKAGRWVHCRLAEDGAAAQRAIGWVKASLAHDDRTREDERRLKQILKLDPEVICKRQCGR